MFRDDFEFHDGAGASHLGPGHGAPIAKESSERAIPLHHPADGPPPQAALGEDKWSAEAQAELKKIPFFVRGKAKRNTENYAAERGVATIELATLYEAKAHYAR
jgi:light-independent protochlorophyllide reductase subunit B